MLASKYRLNGVKNYERVKSEGRIVQSKYFGVAVYERKDNESSKFGFIISTKIAKDATQRNRIKRALSEAVRQVLTQLKNGYDVAFLAKKEIARMSTDEIMVETKEFLKKSVLYKDQ